MTTLQDPILVGVMEEVVVLLLGERVRIEDPPTPNLPKEVEEVEVEEGEQEVEESVAEEDMAATVDAMLE